MKSPRTTMFMIRDLDWLVSDETSGATDWVFSDALSAILLSVDGVMTTRSLDNLSLWGEGRAVVGLACLANRLLKLLGLGRFSRDFATNHPDNPDINYRRCPLKSLFQVNLLMRRVYLGLGAMQLPALIVQGDGDPKVAPLSGPALYRRIGSPFKRYAQISCPQHGIVRGAAAPTTLKAVTAFLAELV